MDEFRRSYVPAFGSWEDTNEYDNIPYSRCFDLATKDKLFTSSYSSEDRDFYTTGKSYDNNVVTSAPMIVLPLPMQEEALYRYVKDANKDGWVVCAIKQPSSSVKVKSRKPVDEDLYKISPELLRFKPKKVSVRGFFSMCLGRCASCEKI